MFLFSSIWIRNFFIFPNMEMYSSKECRRGNKHIDVHFWRIRSVHFLSKDGRYASNEGVNGWKSVNFPPESAFQTFDVVFLREYFSLFFTLTWRANNYVSRQGEGTNRWNESTEDTFINVANFEILFSLFVLLPTNIFSQPTSWFSPWKIYQFQSLFITFPLENGNSEEWAKTCSSE